MNIIARIGLPSLLASVVPAMPFAIIGLIPGTEGSSLFVALVVLLVSTAHVVFLGIPAFFLLCYLKIANRWSLIAAGFALGFLPLGLLNLATAVRSNDPNFSVPLIFGGLGAFSAWIFWVAWCKLSPNNSFQWNNTACSRVVH